MKVNESMTSFENNHFFVKRKEEVGVIFAECIRHNPAEFAVGLRKDESVNMLYIGIDEKYAEDLYSTLVSKFKQIS